MLYQEKARNYPKFQGSPEQNMLLVRFRKEFIRKAESVTKNI